MKYIYILILFSLISCVKTENKPNLNGYWHGVKMALLLPNGQLKAYPNASVWGKSAARRGFKIYGDTIDYILKRQDCDDNLKSKFKYLIKQDSLIITGKCSNEGIKIYSIDTNKIMLFLYDSVIITYEKIKPQNNKKLEFDAVFLSSSGCYGSCPIMNVAMYKDNKVSFLGEKYINPEGYYSGKIATAIPEMQLLEFESYDSAYIAGPPDGEEITLTLVKENKIIKTIKDYGHQSPLELEWFIEQFRDIHEKIKLKKTVSEITPIFLNLHMYNFITGNYCIRLSKSESFYLFELFKSGKLVSNNFNPVYKIDFETDYTYVPSELEIYNDPYNETPRLELNAILTDGRYFRFMVAKKKSYTLDLGFNFIETNNLKSRLEKTSSDNGY